MEQPTKANASTNVTTAAEYSGVSRSYLYQRMDAGELPYVKHGRARRIRWCDLDAFIEANLVGTSLASNE